MAARIRRLRHTDGTRAKIKAGMLIKKLTDHALGNSEIMTTGQVNAAKILLGKTLPDLKALEHSTIDDEGAPTGFKVQFTNDKEPIDPPKV